MKLKAIVLTLLLIPAVLQNQTLPNSPFSGKELNCLAHNVYYEARGESFNGQVLVAKTTINRSKNINYPRNICRVVYQPYQFSWTLTQQPKPTKEGLAKATKAALYAINHSSEALYFHAVSVRPGWSKTKQLLTREGNHIFYK